MTTPYIGGRSVTPHMREECDNTIYRREEGDNIYIYRREECDNTIYRREECDTIYI